MHPLQRLFHLLPLVLELPGQSEVVVVGVVCIRAGRRIDRSPAEALGHIARRTLVDHIEEADHTARRAVAAVEGVLVADEVAFVGQDPTGVALAPWADAVEAVAEIEVVVGQMIFEALVLVAFVLASTAVAAAGVVAQEQAAKLPPADPMVVEGEAKRT